MDKIIETNLSVNSDGVIQDFQSRVIECDWADYKYELLNGLRVDKKGLFNGMQGTSFNQNMIISNVIIEDDKLSCDIVNGSGFKTIRLAYKI